ncbi:type VI secretion-associated protein [Rhodoferax koreense]|uniref:Type VI secretion-associated protein n=1 Tax=Rhodoferax koreensis TaxID=1842727 RepID=A0A1P8JX02_9BURK|nr:type VI secretion-associated protein [Rhodoferax koreense]
MQRLIAHRLVTPPAIWGKLPRHADFVRSGMRHGESEAWQSWLALQGCLDREARPALGAALPTAFVLPPGSLPFAARRFVIGVLAPSVDKVGRSHVLLVYQTAHLRWLRFQFDDAVPHDWLFWLARTVARHVRADTPSDSQAIDQAVRRLWRVYAPGTCDLWARAAASPATRQARRARQTAARRQSESPAAPFFADDLAAQLHGVTRLPWADWPHRLYRPHGHGMFWQQDAKGGFVNAATRLAILWGEA